MVINSLDNHESTVNILTNTGSRAKPKRPNFLKLRGLRRFGLNMISAVSPQGEFRFMIQEGTVNSEVFREFLQRLMKGATRPVILVVDGHPAHKSKLVKDYVEEQEGRLTLAYLPPYSPQLNPDEQVWNWIKSRVAKQVPRNKVELKQAVLSSLRKLQKMPHIVRSFFSHPDCQYARWVTLLSMPSVNQRTEH
jgi:transposase